jgi:hypothetical protein
MTENVGYGSGPPSQYGNDPNLQGQKHIGRFVGFTRKQDGGLSQREKLPYQYFVKDDVVFQRADTERQKPQRKLAPAEVAEIVMETEVYFRLQIVTGEHAGVICPCSCRIKGVYVWEDDEDGWQFWVKTAIDPERKNDRLSGFIETSIALGLNARLLDVTSSFFAELNEDGEKAGHAYVKEALENMEAPLTVRQIVEHLIEPKLLEAAEAGRLVEFTVDPKAKRGNWIKRATIQALSAEDAAKVKVTVDMPAPVEKLDAEALKAELKALVAEGKIARETLHEAVKYHGANPVREQGPMLDQVENQIGAVGLKAVRDQLVGQAKMDEEIPL